MWQQFLDEHAEAHDLAFLSLAVDTDAERVRPFAAPYTFSTVVDSANLLGRLFDFDVVPNLLVCDATGTIQFLHVGGFYLGRPELYQQAEALVHANFAAGERPVFVIQESLELEVIRGQLAHQPDDADMLVALGDALLRESRAEEAADAFGRAAELRPDDWAAVFALGTALRQQGDVGGALDAWRRALALDPSNFTVRKQIWREEFPERFYPTIDTAWQKEQLIKEGYTR